MTEKKPRKPQLNVRRKKFVKNLANGMGVGESALRAGYATRTEGSALLNDPRVLTALQEAMEKSGITDEYLSSKIKDGLEACYPEKRAKDGSVLQSAAPDYFTRNLYLDKALKVRGDYAPERSINEQRQLTINVNMEMVNGLKDCGYLEAEVIGEGDGRKPDEEGKLLPEGNGGREGQEGSR